MEGRQQKMSAAYGKSLPYPFLTAPTITIVFLSIYQFLPDHLCQTISARTISARPSLSYPFSNTLNTTISINILVTTRPVSAYKKMSTSEDATQQQSIRANEKWPSFLYKVHGVTFDVLQARQEVLATALETINGKIDQ